MPSLPVMLFLILLLLPSMLMEESDCYIVKYLRYSSDADSKKKPNPPPTISSDHKTNKGDLDMIVSQGEPNIHEDFEMMIISAFDQEQTLLVDQANCCQHNLNLSELLTALSKCGD
nr:exocrine gland-secreted peptide 1 [Rattus norvegicus]